MFKIETDSTRVSFTGERQDISESNSIFTSFENNSYLPHGDVSSKDDHAFVTPRCSHERSLNRIPEDRFEENEPVKEYFQPRSKRMQRGGDKQYIRKIKDMDKALRRM